MCASSEFRHESRCCMGIFEECGKREGSGGVRGAGCSVVVPVRADCGFPRDWSSRFAACDTMLMKVSQVTLDGGVAFRTCWVSSRGQRAWQMLNWWQQMLPAGNMTGRARHIVMEEVESEDGNCGLGPVTGPLLKKYGCLESHGYLQVPSEPYRLF